MEAIRVEKISKIYKDKTQALNELSLSVQQGDVFTLLGPNGAGKSTLINILTTFLHPTSGKITIFGKDLALAPSEIRKDISCVAQKVSIDGHLSLTENMIFQGRLFGLDKKTIHKRKETLTHSFGLDDYTDKRVAKYSGGIMWRLDIAMSMMSLPKILFLDEPTVGMDIESRQAMWKLVKQISKEFGTTVFLTTHYLEEADMLSDTICIMQAGKEIVQNTPQNLKRYMKQLMIRVSCDTQQAANAFAGKLDKSEFVDKTICTDTDLTVIVRDAQRDYPTILEMVLAAKVPQSGIEIVHPNLDDVFLALTGEGGV